MVKKIGLIIVAISLIVGYVYRGKIKKLFSEDTRTVNQKEVKILFREDPNLDELATVLVEKGVVLSKKDIFDFVEENNIDTTNFAAGKYIILSQTQRGTLVKGFVKGENGQGVAEVKVNVLFNNCPTIEAMAKNISQCILADSASIVSYIYESSTLNKYGFTKEQVPAMFLPKEYKMYFDTDAEDFVAFMANEFKLFWNEERKSKMKQIGLSSPSQVATLASIVYSEQSKDNNEWAVIAKLYLNRLEKGILLQSDPTFKFCWGSELDGVDRLTYKHRDIDCPYNTYLYKGLPPGPIYITPPNVIDAVLNPADVNYIFMMAKPGGGGHNFAVTNAQHEKNVAIYRKWYNEYKRNQ